MKIEVRFHAIEKSEFLREHVVRRARFQLSRFDGQVASVIIRIGDINGPRGGADKHCQVMLRGPALRPVAIGTLNGDAYAAAELALERAARAVDRELARTRVTRRPDRAARSAS